MTNLVGVVVESTTSHLNYQGVITNPVKETEETIRDYKGTPREAKAVKETLSRTLYWTKEAIPDVKRIIGEFSGLELIAILEAIEKTACWTGSAKVIKRIIEVAYEYKKRPKELRGTMLDLRNTACWTREAEAVENRALKYLLKE